jgi:hypothetical protein
LPPPAEAVAIDRRMKSIDTTSLEVCRPKRQRQVETCRLIDAGNRLAEEAARVFPRKPVIADRHHWLETMINHARRMNSIERDALSIDLKSS